MITITCVRAVVLVLQAVSVSASASEHVRAAPLTSPPAAW
jgi:hypothetical protein